MKEQVPHVDFIGKVSYRFDEITSTNGFAKELITNGEPVHGTAILADHQSGGRGQAGNTWIDAPGKNLLCSLIIQPNAHTSSQFYLNKSVALAVADTVKAYTQDKVTIKWPNDVLVEEAKVCGILIENFLQQQTLSNSVVGIGLNVNQLIFPKNLNATSLQLITGVDYSINQVAETLFIHIKKWYDIYVEEKFEEIDKAYHQNLFHYQKPQLFRKNGKQFAGVIAGVNANGMLQIDVNGNLYEFRNQEVAFVI